MARIQYILDTLKEFAEDLNIKEVRKLLKKYSKELDVIETRDLNNTHPIEGYRFVKRNGWTTLIKDPSVNAAPENSIKRALGTRKVPSFVINGIEADSSETNDLVNETDSLDNDNSIAKNDIEINLLRNNITKTKRNANIEDRGIIFGKNDNIPIDINWSDYVGEKDSLKQDRNTLEQREKSYLKSYPDNPKITPELYFNMMNNVKENDELLLEQSNPIQDDFDKEFERERITDYNKQQEIDNNRLQNINASYNNNYTISIQDIPLEKKINNIYEFVLWIGQSCNFTKFIG
jgi:hypothetical protein